MSGETVRFYDATPEDERQKQITLEQQIRIENSANTPVKALGDLAVQFALGHAIFGDLFQPTPESISTPLTLADANAYTHTVEDIAYTNAAGAHTKNSSH